MDFESRIKKEMTEGIVRAVLEDAGYRVVDTGVEKTLREVACMTEAEYLALGLPDAIRKLPDFTVMDREQSMKFMVEVKYRKSWGVELFDEIREQVERFEEMVLVSINANPPNGMRLKYPSTYLRCCRVRHRDGAYEAELKFKNGSRGWMEMEQVRERHGLWWAMSPLETVFDKLNGGALDSNAALDQAIRALSGILTAPGESMDAKAV